jgi:hypothetical protein
MDLLLLAASHDDELLVDEPVERPRRDHVLPRIDRQRDAELSGPELLAVATHDRAARRTWSERDGEKRRLGSKQQLLLSRDVLAATLPGLALR